MSTYVSGVGAGAVGVVGVPGAEGAEGAVPDPVSPPGCGQSAAEPDPCCRGAGCVPGMPELPEPSDGAVVLGAVVGSGLAADTTAAAPPTRSSADSAAVMTARRGPEPVDEVGLDDAGSIAASGTATGTGAGTTGGVVHSMRSPS
ncbi:MAG: hypothetical protein ACJ77V_07135 [Chloroflexota bacterium]